MSDHAISRQIPELYSVETAQHNVHSRYLFQITGDNVDLEIKAKHMTLVRRNKSLHQGRHVLGAREGASPPTFLGRGLLYFESILFSTLIKQKCSLSLAKLADSA